MPLGHVAVTLCPCKLGSGRTQVTATRPSASANPTIYREDTATRLSYVELLNVGVRNVQTRGRHHVVV
jgi:hypothetical protein